MVHGAVTEYEVKESRACNDKLPRKRETAHNWNWKLVTVQDTLRMVVCRLCWILIAERGLNAVFTKRRACSSGIFMGLNSGMASASRGICGRRPNSRRRELLSHWAARKIFHIGTLLWTCRYTPLKKIDHMPGALGYDPIRCNGCSAVLNPYA